MDDVARINQPQPDPAIDGRADLAVAEIDHGGVDLRLILRHQRLILRHGGALGVGLLGRGVGIGGKPGIAGEVDACIGQIGLVLRLLGLGQIQRGLIAAWVDLGEQVARLHVLTFLEIHRDQLAVDL